MGQMPRAGPESRALPDEALRTFDRFPDELSADCSKIVSYSGVGQDEVTGNAGVGFDPSR